MLVKNKSARMHVLNLGEQYGVHRLAPVDTAHNIPGPDALIQALCDQSGGELEAVSPPAPPAPPAPPPDDSKGKGK